MFIDAQGPVGVSSGLPLRHQGRMLAWAMRASSSSSSSSSSSELEGKREEERRGGRRRGVDGCRREGIDFWGRRPKRQGAASARIAWLGVASRHPLARRLSRRVLPHTIPLPLPVELLLGVLHLGRGEAPESVASDDVHGRPPKPVLYGHDVCTELRDCRGERLGSLADTYRMEQGLLSSPDPNLVARVPTDSAHGYGVRSAPNSVQYLREYRLVDLVIALFLVKKNVFDFLLEVFHASQEGDDGLKPLDAVLVWLHLRFLLLLASLGHALGRSSFGVLSYSLHARVRLPLDHEPLGGFEVADPSRSVEERLTALVLLCSPTVHELAGFP
mmetsp:Transcript_26080/g.54338  ORF Transcript_26080/g.54338 Transcript_26080/m.54338 type:complete len:330 (-) Transcript_26080:873-1862(-)